MVSVHASSIHIQAKNAVVWLPQQNINGSVSDQTVKKVTVHFNDSAFILPIDIKHRFVISILLKLTINNIWVEAGSGQHHTKSDTIQLKLGYKPLPLIKPFATSKGNIIFLHADVKSNPYNLPLSFIWSDDKSNPAPVKINDYNHSQANFSLPSKQGDYYFNLTVISGNDSTNFKTMITRTDSIHCFNIETDHAGWIDSTVMYEITPSIFTENANYDDITAKLPELKQLGINCIWLQPVYQSHRGNQAYDVIDYFSLRTDLGTEQQLQYLITTAKSLHIKVLFDFVPDHTSVFHPYAQDVIDNNNDSHYYNFYQHTDDGAQYSSLYKKDSAGFYHYFWKQLINLNFDSEEVQQWMIEACKYWLKKFDLDGYRFDAMWALNARNNFFGTRLQTELKSIKPDILLLAEDKGERKKVYEEGYDAAYDWRTDTNWISKWSWQTDYDLLTSHTVFNYDDETKRGQKLRNALFSGDSMHLRLRFIENNDLSRFINNHGLARTKMAAAFMFALPGIPLIYNGQEIGCTNKIYSTKPVFKSTQSIQSLDKDSLFTYYQQLIKIRRQYKSLRSFNMHNLLANGTGAVLALYRWKDDEQFIVVINMSATAQPVIINLNQISKNKNDSLFFNDMLTGESFKSFKNELSLTMQPYTTTLLMIN